MCIIRDYIPRHRADRGGMYYCRELDTNGYWVTSGRKGGVLTWKTLPRHTKLITKQGVSPSERLIIHSCVIPCLNTEISKSRKLVK